MLPMVAETEQNFASLFASFFAAHRQVKTTSHFKDTYRFHNLIYNYDVKSIWK